jgi:hypothetical protein
VRRVRSAAIATFPVALWLVPFSVVFFVVSGCACTAAVAKRIAKALMNIRFIKIGYLGVETNNSPGVVCRV